MWLFWVLFILWHLIGAVTCCCVAENVNFDRVPSKKTYIFFLACGIVGWIAFAIAGIVKCFGEIVKWLEKSE